MEPIDLSTLPVDVGAVRCSSGNERWAPRFYEDYGRLWAASFGDVDREYEAIRNGVDGLGHLAAVEFHIKGPEVSEALDRLTTRPTANDAPGQVRYLMILDEAARIVDEGTRYLIGPHEAWYIGNEDRPALVRHRGGARRVRHLPPIGPMRCSSLAVQGPKAFESWRR